MLRLMKKDIILNLSNKSFLLIYPIYIIFFTFIFESSDISMYGLMIYTIAFFLTITPFGYEIQTKSHMYIQSLPIKKREIVISRYLTIWSNYIIGFIFSAIGIWIIKFTGLIELEGFNLMLIKTTLPIVILTLSISLPTHFRFPPKIAQVLNIFIYVTIMNLVMMKLGDFKYINNMIFLIIAIVTWFISMGISIWLYETRDFA